MRSVITNASINTLISCVLPQLKVLFAGQDIDRSPFMVNISKAMGDPTRVQARGPGLQPVGNVANKPTYFDIYTAGEVHRY